MRGLSGGSSPEDPGGRTAGAGTAPGRRRRKAGSTATAGLAALALCAVAATACGTGGTGTRDEGAAEVAGEHAPKTSASPAPAEKHLTTVDAVALVKDDPKVSARVRADLKPCFKDAYPVDVSYGNLTGGSSDDVVVNVMTCGDAIGVGSYVYRADGKKYQNVFKAEEPPVYGEIDQGDLVVYRQLYAEDDPVAYPSSEEVITYRWQGDRFKETDRTHNDYSNAVNGPEAAPPEEN